MDGKLPRRPVIYSAVERREGAFPVKQGSSAK